MIAALGVTVDQKDIHCQRFEEISHYLARMGLLKLQIPFDGAFVEHEPAGRFIPITQIRSSDELSKFITEMVPLCILNRTVRTIGYIISELARM